MVLVMVVCVCREAMKCDDCAMVAFFLLYSIVYTAVLPREYL